MKCSQCKEEKEAHSFATFRSRKGEIRRRGVCKNCRGKYAIENFEKLQVWRLNYNIKNKSKKRLRDADRRRQIKEKIDEIKSVPCKDCGRQWLPIAMDFDHIKGKNRSIARMVGGAYSLQLILEEIKLCEVVCACCHRIRTAARKQNLAPRANTNGFPSSRG